MESSFKTNIFLTGFSGTGKTTVGREVASRLEWNFVDLDYEISRSFGCSVPEIFSRYGEKKFRELENDVLKSVCNSESQVIATGGGIVSGDENRRLMASFGVVVCFEAAVDVIESRLRKQQREQKSSSVERPMLIGPSVIERIACLKAERQIHYSMSDWTVHTDYLSSSEVATEVIRALGILNQSFKSRDIGEDNSLSSIVFTSSGTYPVWVGWGEIVDIVQRISDIGLPGAAYVISDENVYKHARLVQSSIERVGVPSHLFLIPPGEKSKSLDMARRIYEWLADARAERGHMIIAVGGGVVGDLAGFVAATFLRVIQFVQVPPTILAMMDSSVGGKTGVDLSHGKNLVGAFHQPKFVLADVQTLQTMDRREMSAGWAEAIKHGLILDEPLLQTFEDKWEYISELDRVTSTDVIKRSIMVKAGVVSKDERESIGVRVLLNYGHTIGHAIEAITKYQEFLHGEAVSIGMMGAAEIARRLGMMTGDEVDRQRSALSVYGLPVSWPELPSEDVVNAMVNDKKTTGGVIRWVLLDGIGHAVTRKDIPEDIVLDSLNALRK